MVDEITNNEGTADQTGCWYVRYEGTGEISGPMSERDALHVSEAAGGIIFSDEIFEPQEEKQPVFSSKQVETLVKEMRSASTRPSEMITLIGCQKLLRRAVDVITLLSHPPAEIIGLLSFLREEKEVCDEMKESFARPLDQADLLVSQVAERVSRICEKSIEALVLFSREKVVTGEIQGGVLTLTNVPEGVKVDITDHDDC